MGAFQESQEKITSTTFIKKKKGVLLYHSISCLILLNRRSIYDIPEIIDVYQGTRLELVALDNTL